MTVIFSFVYQEISVDNFQENAGNIYRIQAGSFGVTPMCFANKLRNQFPEIKNVIRFTARNLDVVDNNEAVSIGQVYYTDPDVFRVFSFRLQSGDATHALMAPNSIVINQSVAHKLFGNSSPLGESIQSDNGQTFTVNGVMDDIPYNSHIQANAFISIESLRNSEGEQAFDCSTWSILTYVCLSGKSDSDELEKKINAFLYNFRMDTGEGKVVLKLEPLKKIYFSAESNKYDGCKHGDAQAVVLYLSISILIMVIVMINYINLATVIAGSRAREIAIRKVHGAGKTQIVKYVVTESLGVALLSFIISLLLATILLPELSGLLNIPVAKSTHLSFLYMGELIVVTALGLITGVVPGMFLSNTNTINALKNGSISGSHANRRKIFMALQLIIVVVLLNSTFTIEKQMNYVLSKDLGFDYQNVIYFSLNNTLVGKEDVLRNDLMKDPAIQNVAFSDGLPGDRFGKKPIQVGDKDKICYFYSIDPDYLALYNIPIITGRNFSTRSDAGKSCLINEAAAKAFNLKDPIGKQAGKQEIIGVVKDFNFSSLYNSIDPLIIYCGAGKVVQIRIAPGKETQAAKFINKTCEDISPGFRSDYSFLELRIKRLYQPEVKLKNSFMVYSVITMAIALLGLVGMTLFLIRKRAKEISIRKLHGAGLFSIIILFVKEEAWIVVISNILAIPISFAVMNEWLNNFQYKISIGFSIYLETFLITFIITLLTVLFLIFKTPQAKHAITLKYG